MDNNVAEGAVQEETHQDGVPAVHDDAANPHISDSGSVANAGILQQVPVVEEKVIPGVVDNASNMLVLQPEMSKFVIYDQYRQQKLITLPSQATFIVQNSVQGNVLLTPVGGMQLNPSYGVQQVQSVFSGYVAPPKGHDNTAVIRNPEDGNAPVPSIPNPEDIAKPKGNGDGSNPPPVRNPENGSAPVPSIPNPEDIVNGSNPPPVRNPEDGNALVPSIPNPEDIAKPKGNGNGSAVSNPPPVAGIRGDTSPEVCPVQNPEDAPVPRILNPEDITKPKANGDGSAVSNPPPVADIKGDTSPEVRPDTLQGGNGTGSMLNSLHVESKTEVRPDTPQGGTGSVSNPDLVNNEVPKSDENGALGHTETPGGSLSNSLAENRIETAKPVPIVKKEDLLKVSKIKRTQRRETLLMTQVMQVQDPVS